MDTYKIQNLLSLLLEKYKKKHFLRRILNILPFWKKVKFIIIINYPQN